MAGKVTISVCRHNGHVLRISGIPICGLNGLSKRVEHPTCSSMEYDTFTFILPNLHNVSDMIFATPRRPCSDS